MHVYNSIQHCTRRNKLGSLNIYLYKIYLNIHCKVHFHVLIFVCRILIRYIPLQFTLSKIIHRKRVILYVILEIKKKKCMKDWSSMQLISTCILNDYEWAQKKFLKCYIHESAYLTHANKYYLPCLFIQDTQASLSRFPLGNSFLHHH